MVDAAALNATLRQLDGGVTSEAEMVELHSTDAANGGLLALFAEAMGGAETQQEQLATEAIARRGVPGEGSGTALARCAEERDQMAGHVQHLAVPLPRCEAQCVARASRRASSWRARGCRRMTAAAFRLHGLGGWRYSARARSEILRDAGAAGSDGDPQHEEHAEAATRCIRRGAPRGDGKVEEGKSTARQGDMRLLDRNLKGVESQRI